MMHSGQHKVAAWTRLLEAAGEVSIKGYKVDARDGAVGKIEQVLYWSDASNPEYIVVDTGRWIFGHKSVLPIQVIEDIDVQNRRLRVGMSRSQVRQAPEFLPGGA